MNKLIHPVIIIGMHRSGTTMLTKMLRELGLFVGWDLNEEYEARYYLNRNEKILNLCGGAWDNPTLSDNLFSQIELKKKLIETLRNDLTSLYAINFLGAKNFIRYRSIMNIDIPWGWKDPRNTFLLPIWLEIFPNAKIIHIYRNGLDIAKSLAVREQSRINRIHSEKEKIHEFLESQEEQFKQNKLTLYIFKKIQYNMKKLNSLYKYENFRIHPCYSIETGFQLWCDYIERAFTNLDNYTQETINIKYEDFLLNPKEHLQNLQKFCGLPCNVKQIEVIAGKVISKRRYAFREDATLLEFYYKIKSNYWMEKLGYNNENLAK